MTAPPNFETYTIHRELGHNRESGRVTYLASQANSPRLVVIKEFQFTRGSPTWSDHRRCLREVQLLKSLSHPGIPQYIEAFDTPTGFCLVQDYKEADNLTTRHGFYPEQIKVIAVQLLEILIYLQRHIPPVIHGDIKPENVLVRTTPAGELEVFLVDFGLSRTSADTPSADSAGIGTFGFIPPEQMRRQLTRASDLYAVGATLICLLSGTATQNIHTLTQQDEPHRYHFRERLLSIDANINPRFLSWLERMVEPNLRDRFPDAQTALETLRPLAIVAKARVSLDRSGVYLRAETFGAVLQAQVRVGNLAPDTVLEGQWRIVPLTYDSGDWITLSPTRFTGNQTVLMLTVDTRRLRADTVYNRELVLQSNGEQSIIPIPIVIDTTALRPRRKPVPLLEVGILLGIGVIFPVTVAIAATAMGQ